MRIAMWSGPRNLSTAMMYAFGQRSDFAVTDEPFYAAYLARTGIDHPMRQAVLANQPQNANDVAATLLGPVPEGKPHWYQKLMTKHMVDGMPLAWMTDVTNVFLIRHPARVIASYAAKAERPTLDDIGFHRQRDLYEALRAKGQSPVVIDSFDIRAKPERALRALCAVLDLAWDPAMLRWLLGGHKDDGVWAPHWYDAVHRSTGFAAPEGDLPQLDGASDALAQAAMAPFRRLERAKLSIS